MIKTFGCKSTEEIWLGRFAKGFSREVQSTARRKMQLINAATILSDLRVPPGNRLEPLQGSRTGEHSIRVNDQFRLCFRWTVGDAYDVKLEDYH